MKTSNRGSVLVLIVLVAVVIFALIALAVDTAIFSTSKNQQQNATDFAALAAIKAQREELSLETDPKRTPLEALTAALDEAERVLQSNAEKNLGRFLRSDPSMSESALEIFDGGAISSDSNGFVESGCWFFSDPGCGGTFNHVDSCGPGKYTDGSCPCSKGAFVGPCFRGLKRDDAGGTALRVAHWTHPRSPLNALFGRIFAHSRFGTGTAPKQPLRSESIVTISPRNIVFLPDVTSTLTFDSHYGNYIVDCSQGRKGLQGLKPPGRSSFQIITAGTGARACPKPGHAPSLDYIASRDRIRPDEDSGPSSTTTSDSLNSLLRSGCAEFRDLRDPFSWYVPRWDDYKCVDMPYKTLEDDQDHSARFWIDYTYEPQPLSAVLDSVWRGLDSFNSSNVPGDGVAVLAFDRELIDKRMLVTEESQTKQRLLANASSPIFKKWHRALKPWDDKGKPRSFDDSTEEDRLGLFLFERQADSKNRLAYSDIPMALAEARDLISRSVTRAASYNAVVLFTDGFTLCAGRDPKRCDTQEDKYNASISEIRHILLEDPNNYKELNIALHVALAGATVGPHTVLHQMQIPNTDPPQYRCMTPEEAAMNRRLAVDVSDSVWLPWIGRQAYYRPNEFYNFVYELGGVWNPLRPPLYQYRASDGGIVSKNPVKFQIYIDWLCQKKPKSLDSNRDLTNNGAGYASDTIKLYDLEGNSQKYLDDNGEIRDATQTLWQIDPKGRVLFDPDGRTFEQQTENVMTKILGRPPFILVMQ